MPPANDEPEGAAFIGDGILAFSTIGATDSPDVSIPSSCGGIFGDEIRRDVWFEYRAGRTGWTNISTCPTAGAGVGSEFDPILVVRDPSTLAIVACNDEAPGCVGYAVVQFPTVAGARYLLQIGGHDEYIGNGAMRILESGTPAQHPVNENCALASNLPVGVIAEFDLLGAASDDVGCGDTLPDIWFRVSARGSEGVIAIDACGADGDAGFEVVRDSCDGERICGSIGACGVARVEVPVGAEDALLVRVRGTERGTGEIFAQFEAVGACPADITGDGDVGAADLSLLLAAWGQSGSTDIDGDGQTSAADLSLLLESWGPCD